MPLPPVDPSFSVTGADWNVGGVEGIKQPSTDQAPQSEGFGDMLAGQIEALSNTQTEAAKASASLAEGTATDPAAVVMAVERARLSMQLASQIRTKAVEAYSDIFHTQV